MRKLYMAIAAFAALTLSQIGHAIPTIPGATDIASNDGQTYFGLMAKADGWYIEGFNSNGKRNGFNVQLTPNEFLTPATQAMVGLAFDGSSFYLLRDDSNTVYSGADTWSVVGFNLDGSWNGNAVTLGPSQYVTPSQQHFVGMSIAEEGLFLLRDDSQSSTEGFRDSWTLAGFDPSTGAWNGIAQTMSENPSATPYAAIASFNLSPTQHEATANISVPEPGTGLLIGSLLGLGLLGRKKLKAA